MGEGLSGSNVDTRVPGSSETQENVTGPQSLEHCRCGQASRRPLWHKDNCSNLQGNRREESTQVYLKHRDQSVGLKFTEDLDESETVIYKLVQAVVQQTQQHMYKQLQQSLQQMYSGLTLGTPVWAKDYTADFLKQPDTIILTEAKQIDTAETGDLDQNEDNWNAPDVQNTIPKSTINNTSTPNSTESTTPKVGSATADNTSAAFGGARRKTGSPPRSTRPSAVIQGRPTGLETPDEYEDYFNPRIYRPHTLLTTSSSFATAVSIRSRPPRHHLNRDSGNIDQAAGQRVLRPWDNRPYGCETRSQEALCARAERKVQCHYPNYKD